MPRSNEDLKLTAYADSAQAKEFATILWSQPHEAPDRELSHCLVKKLRTALCAAVELENRARGVEPPKEG